MFYSKTREIQTFRQAKEKQNKLGASYPPSLCGKLYCEFLNPPITDYTEILHLSSFLSRGQGWGRQHCGPGTYTPT